MESPTVPQSLAAVYAHIVFSTKDRAPTIQPGWAPRLYEYVGGIIAKRGGVLLAAGGMPDHVHLLVSLGREWSLADLLRDVKAGSLSGGEQQMLTICRSLLGNPQVLLIDEPTEGLAPKIVEVVMDVILDIRRRGVAVVLVEQKLTIALRIAETVFVMGHGEIVFSDSPEELRSREDVRREWLQVA